MAISILPQGGFLPGYLLIEIKGRGIARLMNLTVREGISLGNLRSQGDTVTVRVSPRDFKRLRPLLRITGCSVHILEKKGGLLLSLAGRNRKSLLIGLILFCGLLYYLASFVWIIDITGNEAVGNGEIMTALGKYGVTVGVPKKQLDPPWLEKALLLDIEELSWVGVRLRGVYLEIQVVERLREPAGLGETFDLVAAKDGLVVDVLVLAGEAAVEAGETVRKGQLLISGSPVVTMPGEPDPGERDRARGMVEALVWYEAFSQAPLFVIQKTKTGSVSHSYSCIVKDKNHHLWGNRSVPYRNYELEKIRYVLAWRNLRFPVEIVSSRFSELEISTKTVPPADALQEARRRALLEINEQFPRGGITVNKRYVDDYYFPEMGTVGARVMIETLEDIAIPFNLNNAELGSDVLS
ncbi:MAG TPA: sporulation protein YqfD [Firmicutes bacterium]|nr:sporulation protein YqfD [Bacillota bacterium]